MASLLSGRPEDPPAIAAPHLRPEEGTLEACTDRSCSQGLCPTPIEASVTQAGRRPHAPYGVQLAL